MTKKVTDIRCNSFLLLIGILFSIFYFLLSNSAFAQDDFSAPPADWGFSPAPANNQPPADWGFGSRPSNGSWGSQPPADWGFNSQPASSDWGTRPSVGSWGTQPSQSSWGTQPSRGGVRITNPLQGIADSIPQLINYVLDIVKGLAYFVALGMIIYGAYQIMIGEQGGNKSKYLAGWKTIQYAVIGFALILLSSVIADVVRELVAGV